MLGLAARQLLQPRGKAFARRFGLIERAQGLAFGIGGPDELAVSADKIALELRQFLARGIERSLCRIGSLAQGGQALLEFGEAVSRLPAGPPPPRLRRAPPARPSGAVLPRGVTSE